MLTHNELIAQLGPNPCTLMLNLKSFLLYHTNCFKGAFNQKITLCGAYSGVTVPGWCSFHDCTIFMQNWYQKVKVGT